MECFLSFGDKIADIVTKYRYGQKPFNGTASNGTCDGT